MAIPTKVIKVVTEGPQGPQGPIGPIGPQGIPGSADGSWIRRAEDDSIYYPEASVGIGEFQIEAPEGELEIKQPVERLGNNLFIVKSYDSTSDQFESRFMVNAQGVTVLGAFIEAPTAVEGGLYYNANGNFYLGFE